MLLRRNLSTMTSGKGLLRVVPIAKIYCTTTGIGSGIGVTESWGTTACMASIFADGVCKQASPSEPFPMAVDTASRTTKRHRTHTTFHGNSRVASKFRTKVSHVRNMRLAHSFLSTEPKATWKSKPTVDTRFLIPPTRWLIRPRRQAMDSRNT